MTRQFNIGFKSSVAMRKIQQTKKGARKIENQIWRSRQKLEHKKKKRKRKKKKKKGKGLLDRKPKVAVLEKIKAKV